MNELIFNVKQMISAKGYQEEYNFTDSYIAFLIDVERANIFNKTQEISNLYYQKTKLKLNKKGDIYISEEIPNIIGHTTPTKEFYTIKGLTINNEIVASYITNREWNLKDYYRFTKYKNKFTIINNNVYISIVNYEITDIDKVELEAIFGNPLEVHIKNNPDFIFMQDDFEYPMPNKYISIISNNIFNLYIRVSYEMARDNVVNKDER